MADGREALEVFVGEWIEQVLVPEAPAGRTTFEWMLDGKYLLQRADSPLPEFPDGLMVISYDEDSGTYTQHYFDSRGVTRLYKMSLGHGVWTLRRDRPDFSPSALRAALRGHLLGRRRHDRGPVGDVARRRRHLGARLRPALHQGQVTAVAGTTRRRWCRVDLPRPPAPSYAPAECRTVGSLHEHAIAWIYAHQLCRPGGRVGLHAAPHCDGVGRVTNGGVDRCRCWAVTGHFLGRGIR
jgi:hypothetical protein